MRWGHWMKLSLVVLEGQAKGKQILVSQPFVIGRDSRSNLRPVSLAVAARHCELLIREERAFVKDLGSTNGTFVNGEQVECERQLNDGDLLRIGPIEFEVGLETADPASGPAPPGAKAFRWSSLRLASLEEPRGPDGPYRPCR